MENDVHIFTPRLVRREPGFQKRGVADDDSQDIIEIMGNAAGKSPDSFQLLRVLQLFLYPLALGHIHQHKDAAGISVLLIEDGSARDEGSDFDPVRCTKPKIVLLRSA